MWRVQGLAKRHRPHLPSSPIGQQTQFKEIQFKTTAGGPLNFHLRLPLPNLPKRHSLRATLWMSAPGNDTQLGGGSYVPLRYLQCLP